MLLFFIPKNIIAIRKISSFYSLLLKVYPLRNAAFHLLERK